MENTLTPEQYALFEEVLNEYDRLRSLSPEEKENLIISITSTTFIDLLSDWAFKHVFGHDERNLIPLLNDILSENIVHIEYDSNEIDRWKGDDKKVIMDVLCHTKEGKSFIVEMQRADKEFLRNRMFFYGASMASAQLRNGDEYGKLMPVYVVCFMNFCLKHETSQLIYKYQIREASGELFGSQLTICLCELPRLVDKPKKDMNPIEVWFDILQNMTNFAKKPVEYSPQFDSIFEASRQSPIPDNDRKQYLRSMINNELRSYLTEEDRSEIRAEALAEGRAEGRAEVAKELERLGVDADIIRKATGL